MDRCRGLGHYKGEQAIAVGAFYRTTENFLFNLGASFVDSKDSMFNLGMSYRFGGRQQTKKPTTDQLNAKVTQLTVVNGQLLVRLEARADETRSTLMQSRALIDALIERIKVLESRR